MIEINKNQIIEGYLGYESEHLEKFVSSLEVAYKTVEDAMTIAKGLCFWDYMCSMRFGNEERIEIYKAMKDYENIHIATIAAIECLPDLVWRKLLWRKNIDFMSLESFLRRLSDEQRTAIKDSAASLHGFVKIPRIPNVCKEKFFDRILVFLGIITVAKLMVKPINDSDIRYFSKGAWAFNLLGIDFGFSLYPMGIKDDTKITNKKWTRFLSIKEHINDFIVNCEDGTYWWMYSTSRSFLTYRLDTEVRLKSHVCPGFWATLIFHLYFWIISPIMSFIIFKPFVFGNIGWHDFSFKRGLFAVLFGYTPFYVGIVVSVALCALVMGTLSVGFQFFAPGLTKWFKSLEDKKWFPKFEKSLKFAMITLIGVVLIWGLYAFLGFISKPIATAFTAYYLFMEKYLHSGFLQTTILNVLIVLLIIRIFTRKVINLLIKTVHVVGIMFAINLLDAYVIKVVFTWIGDSIMWVHDLCVNYTWSVLLMLFLFSPFILIVYLMFATGGLNEEENWAQKAKFGNVFFKVWAIAFMGLIIWSSVSGFNTFLATVSLEDYLPVLVTIAFFSLICVAMLYLVNKNVNMETIGVRNLAYERTTYAYNSLTLFNYDISKKESKSIKKYCLKNHWLMSLTEDKFQEVLGAYRKSVNEFGLAFDSFVGPLFIKLALKYLTPEILANLKKVKKEHIRRLTYESSKDVFISMLKGNSFLESKKSANSIQKKKLEKSRRKKERQESWMSFIDVIVEVVCYPFMKIWQFLKWIGNGIRQFVLTLKDLWDLFNKHCPEVSRGENLKN